MRRDLAAQHDDTQSMRRTAQALITCLPLVGCSDGNLSASDTGLDARMQDASTGDAGASSPALDAPRASDTGPAATGCAAHDYLFCEDFESAAVGALPLP
jgi:hypothetical protein